MTTLKTTVTYFMQPAERPRPIGRNGGKIRQHVGARFTGQYVTSLRYIITLHHYVTSLRPLRVVTNVTFSAFPQRYHAATHTKIIFPLVTGYVYTYFCRCGICFFNDEKRLCGITCERSN